MNTDADYKNLIKDVKNYYKSMAPELRNIRNGNEIFDLVWCDELINEINLWTYWQGVGVESPEVMIVGQDFGSCCDDDGFFNKCVRSNIKDRESISREYIDKMIISQKNTNKTDNMLLELTEQGLGKKYSAAIPGNKTLFMTNLCLGYRSTDKISGGNLNAYLKHDSVYISKLIEIKKPKVVICLGLDTYFNLVSVFRSDPKALKKIALDFWKALDSGNNWTPVSRNGVDFKMYGVSHAGSNGAMNRKKYCTRKNVERLSGRDLMIEDWKKIGKYLRNG